MKTIILAGGRGTRLVEETQRIPKPMVEIGNRPILWHILNIYSNAGFHDFVVAVGYRGEVIKNYFAAYVSTNSDIEVDFSRGGVPVKLREQDVVPPWRLALVDTGQATQTGGRIKRAADWLDGEDTFMLSYGDGLADVDVRKLIDLHRSHGRLATLTSVRPPARFGSVQLEGDQVTHFGEKQQLDAGWINGGFFVLNRAVLQYIDGDDTIWEREPLERLAADGQLMAYKHEGFWHPMDTLRDKIQLEELWAEGDPPWKVWP